MDPQELAAETQYVSGTASPFAASSPRLGIDRTAMEVLAAEGLAAGSPRSQGGQSIVLSVKATDGRCLRRGPGGRAGLPLVAGGMRRWPREVRAVAVAEAVAVATSSREGEAEGHSPPLLRLSALPCLRT